MILNKLTVNNFKNIRSASLEFSPKMNCFLGNNGMGKSNLLDAVHYLSFCRSFSGLTDQRLVTDGERFLMLQGDYLRHDVPEDVQASYDAGKKKVFKRKGKVYKRLSEHIGLFPLVLVAPHDIDLINGTSEERRRFIDQIISQSDARYLDSLIRYNHLLEQRNRMLRDHITDRALFEAVELPMSAAAAYVSNARKGWIDDFMPVFNRYYAAIAGMEKPENVAMAYSTTIVPGDPLSLVGEFDKNRQRDEAVGHTTAGVHRDDIEMMLNGLPVRRMASQGQCKTYLIAMRFAQYDFLRRATGMYPLMLLDDIFDRLDAGRVERIVAMVSGEEFGQTFITDTNLAHLDSIITRLKGDHRLFAVESGEFRVVSDSEN
ncbi:MAG: DNA replication and repair protein RecF [Muribaculaceae bacterium]|nr:DNA replication and repair protein RecF [Muribaculaceae bacterium]